MGMDPQLTGLASQKQTLNASKEFHGNQGLLKMQGRESGLQPEGSRGIQHHIFIKMLSSMRGH